MLLSFGGVLHIDQLKHLACIRTGVQHFGSLGSSFQTCRVEPSPLVGTLVRFAAVFLMYMQCVRRCNKLVL